MMINIMKHVYREAEITWVAGPSETILEVGKNHVILVFAPNLILAFRHPMLFCKLAQRNYFRGR